MRAIYRSNEENTMDSYQGSTGAAYPDEREPGMWVFYPDEAKNGDSRVLGFYCEPDELYPV